MKFLIHNGINSFLIAINVACATLSVSWTAVAFIFCFTLFNVITFRDNEK